jgi:hypothetical protein
MDPLDLHRRLAPPHSGAARIGVMNLKGIEDAVMALSGEDRAYPAHRLLCSRDELTEWEFNSAWVRESERRAAERDCGTTQSVPADEVASKARALLR